MPQFGFIVGALDDVYAESSTEFHSVSRFSNSLFSPNAFLKSTKLTDNVDCNPSYLIRAKSTSLFSLLLYLFDAHSLLDPLQNQPSEEFAYKG